MFVFFGFGKVMDLQCSNVVTLPDGYGEITVPTLSFNVIYILSHLYRHVFTEGIGLRQLLDYYFVVVKWYANLTNGSSVRGIIESPTDFTEDTDLDVVQREYAEGQNTDGTEMMMLQHELKWLGLWKFAGAVMYVLHEVFGLKEEKMIAPMNEKEGIFLLDEIMRGGNFGQYDDRLGDKTGEGKVHRYFRMSLRNTRFVKHYPSEAICEPLFRTWFFFWKKSKK